MKSKLDKFTKICILILLVALFINSLLLSYIYCFNYLPYKDCTLSSISYNFNDCEILSKNEIKYQIDKLFNYPNYTLAEQNLQGESMGYTWLFKRQIVIEQNQSVYQYTHTLTHELVHLIYFCGNERYANFKTFKILYESGNEFFKNCALQNADYYCREYGSQEYNYAGYAQAYLQNIIN